jgi:AraC family transcriptional regulator
MSDPIQQEDAFIVGLHLRVRPEWEYWEDGRRASVFDVRAGESCLHDLKREPRWLIDKPYHSLAFYLPRTALDAIADDANAPRIRDLSYKPGAGVNDVTISGLGSLRLPALRHSDQANPLFVEHVLLAVGGISLRPMEACGQCHGQPGVGLRHGRSDARRKFFAPTSRAVWRSGRWRESAACQWVMRPMSQPPRGGLAPWQQRRAIEILRANIKRGVTLNEVARECGLSVGYFSHSFRRSLGVAPHKWLIEQRVVLSKEKLRDDGLSLSDVATECGFSDQSHLTRVFRQTVGVSPGAWRRAVQR